MMCGEIFPIFFHHFLFELQRLQDGGQVVRMVLGAADGFLKTCHGHDVKRGCLSSAVEDARVDHQMNRTR